MINLRSFFLVLLVSISAVTSFNCHAQKFADKAYYLVDSLVLEDFSEQDRELLEMCLSEFHATDDDTMKVRAIYYLTSEMINTDWTKYNELVYQIARRKLNENLEPKEEHFYYLILSQAIGNQGYLYDIKGETALAIEKYEEALDISFQISDELGISMGLNNLGVSYDDMGDFQKAIAYYNEALKIRRELNSADDIASTLNNLGLMYNQTGNVKLALECLFESLAIYDSLDMKNDLARMYNTVGSIYREQEDYNKAFEYHYIALDISKEIESKDGLAYSFCSLGNCYRLTGELSTAENYYKSSLKLNEDINDLQGSMRDEQNLGELYAEMGRYNESLQVLKEALNKAINANYHLDIIRIKIVLSKTYLLLADTENAFNNVNESLEMARKLGMPRLERDALLQLSKCYKHTGEYEKGWEAYEQYIILNDSVKNYGIQKNALIEETNYLLDVKDKEVALMNQEAEMLRERERLGNYYLFGILTFVLIGITSGFIGYRAFKKKRANDEHIYHEELVLQAKEIEKLRDQLNESPETKDTTNELDSILTDLNAHLTVPLSQRELSVLTELVKGNSNQEIADSLYVSINTVKSHLIKIYNKLGVNNRTQAVQKIHKIRLDDKV